MTETPPGEADELVSRPKINPSFVPVEVTPNKVHFRAGPWSGPVFTLEDEDGSGQLSALVERLDGTETTAEILSEAAPSSRDSIRSVIRSLQERRIVYDAAETGEASRRRAAKTRRFSDADFETFDDASVLVVGPREMTALPVSDVLRTNIDAVLTMTPRADGMGASFDDDRVEQVPRGQLDESLADVDFAMVFADRPNPGLLEVVNRTAYDHGTPWIVAQACGYDGIVGPLIVPGESSCYECFRRRREANLPEADEYGAFEEAADRRQESPGPDVRAFERVVAGLGTVDALNYLTYGFGFTAGRIVHYDFATFSMEVNDVLPMPRCPVCGTGTRVDSNRYFTLDNLIDDLDRRRQDESRDP